ncbi:hypothetical protein D3C87_1260460 [compost metagenome]
MASPKVERSQPVSASMGSWKKPIAERGPKVMTAISDPATMIAQGMVWRVACDMKLSRCSTSPRGTLCRKIPL